MDMFCKPLISDEEPQFMSTVVEPVVHNVSKSHDVNTSIRFISLYYS